MTSAIAARWMRSNLDLEYTFEDSFFRAVKVGGRWSERRERDLNNGFTWSALGPRLERRSAVDFRQCRGRAISNIYAFDNFFHGGIAVPANTLWPSIELVEPGRGRLHQPPPAGFCGPPFSSDLWWNCSASGPLPKHIRRCAVAHRRFLLPNDLGVWSTETLAGYGAGPLRAGL